MEVFRWTNQSCRSKVTEQLSSSLKCFFMFMENVISGDNNVSFEQ